MIYLAWTILAIVGFAILFVVIHITSEGFTDWKGFFAFWGMILALILAILAVVFSASYIEYYYYKQQPKAEVER